MCLTSTGHGYGSLSFVLKCNMKNPSSSCPESVSIMPSPLFHAKQAVMRSDIMPRTGTFKRADKWARGRGPTSAVLQPHAQSAAPWIRVDRLRPVPVVNNTGPRTNKPIQRAIKGIATRMIWFHKSQKEKRKVETMSQWNRTPVMLR